MGYLLQIVETEAQPVLSVRTTTSLAEMPQVVGSAYGRIADYVAGKGEELVGPAFIAYYNMDMDHLIVEIGFPVTREIQGKDDIELRYIPAGKKATGFFKGAYSDIAPVYEQLNLFIKDKGCEPTGVVYEYYYNAPGEIPESELLTKVEFLLKE